MGAGAEVIDTYRWRLDITFDTLEAQKKSDPERAFPFDDCTRLIAWLSTHLSLTTEEFNEIVKWNDEQTHITIFSPVIDMYDDIMHFAIMSLLPKSIEMTREY